MLFSKMLAALCAYNAVAQDVFLAKPKQSSEGYLAYADFAGTPYNVTYDKRSLRINDEPTLFLSGAVHPPRGTQAMWQNWFTQAVENGLNMVQVYTFWNFHEPVEGQGYWEDNGDLAKFVEMAAAQGLFVNLRVGPYVCAEWTYGGLPHWLGLKEGVKFRQTNAIWQNAMEKFFTEVIERMAQRQLFSTQGGPIVLVQIENELPATDLGYVQWCGDMANRVLAERGAGGIPLEMCNGESANNTINTCNGNDCSWFLENNGQSGRILVDQPALWTENEGGFQVWGGAPPPGKEPYFWGRSESDIAMSVMKWFARGGSHMNYYMWTGGNNYGRWHGASITTMYAVDVQVCPDGLPHEPKFSHTTAMHRALREAAAQIVAHPAQVKQPVALEWFNPETDEWAVGTHQIAYIYGDVAFVESSASVEVLARVQGLNITLPPFSSSLMNINNGVVAFNTATVTPAQRHRAVDAAPAFNGWSWQAWQEPLAVAATLVFPSVSAMAPIEQGELSKGLTVYAFYEQNVTIGGSKVELSITTHVSNAFVVFVDGQHVGQAENHDHDVGMCVLTLDIDATNLQSGTHLLSILSEDLGFPNYGFWGRMTKGVDGTVKLGGVDITNDGWRMRSGLAGEHLGVMTTSGADKVQWSKELPTASTPLTWYRSPFEISVPDSASTVTSVLLNATGLGRGRLYVNGHDLGRYWDLERNGSQNRPTQQLYHIPADWLSSKGENVLSVLEVSGATDLMAPFLVFANVIDGVGPDVPPASIAECRF